MDENRWAIMDNKGIIEEADYETINTIWGDEAHKYPRIHGDLRLIEIHEVRN